MNPTLQTLGQSLGHWQAIYIVSIVVALASTFAIVLFAFHIQEHKFGLKVSNYIYVIASLLAVLATIVILNKTRSVDAEKDRQVRVATDAADLKIAQAKNDAAKALSDAATANQKAQEAQLKAEETSHADTSLKVELNKHEGQEKEVQNKLAAQEQQTAQFAQGVAQQQQGMAQQIQATPSLGPAQIDQIATLMKPFAGQSILIHVMMDAHSTRLADEFAQAFKMAGIEAAGPNIDVGRNYEGVMVIVKNPTPQPHPPIADALLNAIRSVGIVPKFVYAPDIPSANDVWLCIGPE